MGSSHCNTGESDTENDDYTERLSGYMDKDSGRYETGMGNRIEINMCRKCN